MLRDRHKFFGPWTSDVKKLLTVTYERPMIKIFKYVLFVLKSHQTAFQFEQVQREKAEDAKDAVV